MTTPPLSCFWKGLSAVLSTVNCSALPVSEAFAQTVADSTILAEKPVQEEKLELAPGDDGDLLLECLEGTMDVIVNSRTYRLADGEILAVPIAKPSEVDLECRFANTRFSAGTKCFTRGHLRAFFLNGMAILGCFDRPVPASLSDRS